MCLRTNKIVKYLDEEKLIRSDYKYGNGDDHQEFSRVLLNENENLIKIKWKGKTFVAVYLS